MNQQQLVKSDLQDHLLSQSTNLEEVKINRETVQEEAKVSVEAEYDTKRNPESQTESRPQENSSGVQEVSRLQDTVSRNRPHRGLKEYEEALERMSRKLDADAGTYDAATLLKEIEELDQDVASVKCDFDWAETEAMALRESLERMTQLARNMLDDSTDGQYHQRPQSVSTCYSLQPCSTMSSHGDSASSYKTVSSGSFFCAGAQTDDALISIGAQTDPVARLSTGDMTSSGTYVSTGAQTEQFEDIHACPGCNLLWRDSTSASVQTDILEGPSFPSLCCNSASAMTVDTGMQTNAWGSKLDASCCIKSNSAPANVLHTREMDMCRPSTSAVSQDVSFANSRVVNCTETLESKLNRFVAERKKIQDALLECRTLAGSE